MALRLTLGWLDLMQGLTGVAGRACPSCLVQSDNAMFYVSHTWHGATHSRCFASKGSDARRRGPAHRGARYGIKLQQDNPALFERMRTLLGFHELPGRTVQKPPAPITSVTISMLQTQRYLQLPEDLKRQLMHYKVVSLNRQVESAHSHTLQYLASLQDDQTGKAEARQSRGPAGLASMLQKAQQRSSQGSS